MLRIHSGDTKGKDSGAREHRRPMKRPQTQRAVAESESDDLSRTAFGRGRLSGCDHGIRSSEKEKTIVHPKTNRPP